MPIRNVYKNVYTKALGSVARPCQSKNELYEMFSGPESDEEFEALQ